MPPITPLDVAYLQSKAEILEMEARIASEESQKTAEQQFGQIFDNKGVRVTHACEHCRQRKAKVRPDRSPSFDPHKVLTSTTLLNDVSACDVRSAPERSPASDARNRVDSALSPR